jgi:hypothetical protein
MAAPALIARTAASGLEYLALAAGQKRWVNREVEASLFVNVREATRTAMLLPARLRAYALPAAGFATAR